MVREEQRYLSAEEVEALAARIDSAIASSSTLRHLGLRWQEVAGLKRQYVNVRTNPATIRVVSTISGEWVFQSPKGGFLHYDNFRTRVWDPAVEQAGLAPPTLHELRHTAAVFMVDEGGDPVQVKRRMAHEDIRTTLNTYGHLFPDREDELVTALDRRHHAAAGTAC